MVETTIADIKARFSHVVGAKLVCYETAELLLDDGTWDRWADLPIRLYMDSGALIAVSWSQFDTLWIRTDMSLPFPVGDASIRWVRNSIEKLDSLVGGTIGSVMIGRGEMSIEGKDIEVWTRLLIQVGEGWLEIFNALDENGYDVHVSMPAGRFVRCV
jgi:hypothetical protein